MPDAEVLPDLTRAASRECPTQLKLVFEFPKIGALNWTSRARICWMALISD
jgi:hypothetical protein